VASYTVNRRGVAKAKELIDAGQVVVRSSWQDVQPNAARRNAFLESHSWGEYAAWHLGLTEGARDETKARYAFVFGDFRRVHRMGLIACYYRAAEWGHTDIYLAAHRLLQRLDKARNAGRSSVSPR
jgi:pimeloyl-ACP methyl ester carboxylesterase